MGSRLSEVELGLPVAEEEFLADGAGGVAVHDLQDGVAVPLRADNGRQARGRETLDDSPRKDLFELKHPGFLPSVWNRYLPPALSDPYP